jgi:hypothetical protein
LFAFWTPKSLAATAPNAGVPDAFPWSTVVVVPWFADNADAVEAFPLNDPLNVPLVVPGSVGLLGIESVIAPVLADAVI